jgi:hypothetical protein
MTRLGSSADSHICINTPPCWKSGNKKHKKRIIKNWELDGQDCTFSAAVDFLYPKLLFFRPLPTVTFVIYFK